MKKRFILIIAMFLLPLFSIGAYCSADKDATVSVHENRMLKTLPPFSFKDLFLGDYTLKFEEYFTDTFPFRDTFMSANTELNRLYYFNPSGGDNLSLMIPQDSDLAKGGESVPASNETDIGTSAVPAGPSAAPASASPSAAPGNPSSSASPSPSPASEPAPELENPDKADLQSGSIIIVGNRAMEITSEVPAVMTSYAETLNLYQEKMPDARIISLLTPNGGEFYSPEEFHTGSHSQKDLIEKTYGQMNDNVVTVDAYSELRQHTDEYIFFRTDHHWTQLGAYYAYTAFCKSLGFEPYTLDKFESGQIDNFVGSMYTFTSKYPQSSVLKKNPDTLYFYRPVRDFTSKVYTDSTMNESTSYDGYVVSGKVSQSNKYLAFICGDTPLFHIKTDVGNGKKIIVIKESYGNAFVPFLVNHYDEIFVIDPRKYSGDKAPSFDLPSFVAEHDIDDVLVMDYPLFISSKRYVGVLRNIIK